MRVLKFLETYPNFMNMQSDRKEQWDIVRKQIITHTRRCENIDLITQKRPGESPESLKYRKDNYRPITKAPILEMLTKSVRVFSESSIDLTQTSDELKLLLKKNIFRYLGQKIDNWEYWYNCLVMEGIEDPNAVLLPFPYNKENPFVAPGEDEKNGGLGRNRRVDILPKLIPSNQIAFMPEDDVQVFAWHAGEKQVQGGKEGEKAVFYYLVDEYDYYVLNPVRRDKAVVLIPAKWYPHNTGRLIDDSSDEIESCLPISVMPGIICKNEDGNFRYNESLIYACLPYYDEVVTRFSDCGIVATKFAHPDKVFNADVSCSTCKGKGTVQGPEDDGAKTCNKCGGTGKNAGDSPTNTYYRKSSGLKEGSNRALIDFPHADVAILDHSYQQCFDLLDKGSQKIGVQMLVDASESGKAKEMRLLPSEDFMKSLATGFIGNMKTRFLFNVECLLQRDVRSRKIPIIKLPETYKIKDYDVLSERAKNTFGSLRLFAELEAINKLYEQSPLVADVFNWAYCYCPLLALTPDEWQLRIDNGTYNRSDVQKVDLMPAIIKEFLAKDNLAQRDQAAFVKYADDYLKANIATELPLFEEETT